MSKWNKFIDLILDIPLRLFFLIFGSFGTVAYFQISVTSPERIMFGAIVLFIFGIWIFLEDIMSELREY